MEEDGKNLRIPSSSQAGPLGSGDQGHLEAITLDLTPPQEVCKKSAGAWGAGTCSATYYLFLLSLQFPPAKWAAALPSGELGSVEVWHGKC